MAEQALHKVRLVRQNYIGFSLLSSVLLALAIANGCWCYVICTICLFTLVDHRIFPFGCRCHPHPSVSHGKLKTEP